MIVPAASRLRILLFAAVPQRAMLDQGFYAAEVDGLLAHPDVAEVTTTNRLADIRTADIDGIVSYFYSHSAAVGALAKARGIPAVATGGCEQLVRNQASSTANYMARLAAFHGCTLLMKRLLATSTTDYERMSEIALFDVDRITLSFHGVSAVEGVSRSRFDRSRPPASLITIAGLDTADNVRRKGVLEAVDLLARFRNFDPDASLTIIGRTTCRDLVERHALQRGVLPHVRFTSYVTEDEKTHLLRKSRFYVQLSEYEGFGVGAIEALAQGCQVLHSNVGGLRDTIGDYGVVVPRDAIFAFDPNTLPAYVIDDWSAFERHLAQFRVDRRANTILRALGLNNGGVA